MATKSHVRTKKESESSQYDFDKPTALVNCMTPCSKCAILEPFVNDKFKAYCKRLGFEVSLNKASNKTAGYWKKYGKPNKVGQTTPQVYAINGEKSAGIALVEGAELDGYAIPPVEKWSETMLKKVAKLLIEKVK